MCILWWEFLIVLVFLVVEMVILNNYKMKYLYIIYNMLLKKYNMVILEVIFF